MRDNKNRSQLSLLRERMKKKKKKRKKRKEEVKNPVVEGRGEGDERGRFTIHNKF